MKISYHWLKNYLALTGTPEETAEILTAIGLEVEGIEKWESVKGGLEGLRIGFIQSVEKHPNADKLTVTQVSVGHGEPLLQIVCGAPNVAAGQKVMVAPVDVTLHPFAGEPFTIKKAKIRGVESQGMICAEDEVGLSDDHSGIKVLADDAPVGSLAKDYFNVEHDFIFEIGLTANRGDAHSHIGVARDLAAFLHSSGRSNAEVQFPSPLFSVDDHSLQIEVAVENIEACPRYSGLTVSGITVRESPDWLKNKLKSVGLRPINNVVDVTNFVMLEWGQPLHAFDAAKIAGRKIIVRCLPPGTAFRTLDDKEVKLAADDLVICDAEAGMCIAGVYGGLHSGVTQATSSVFLESACFNPRFIRRTSTRLQLRTDAASHFEKGTDPSNTVTALQRAASLMKEICGGKISSGMVDLYPQPVEKKQITLAMEKLNRVAGVEIPVGQAEKILRSLQFEIRAADSEKITVAAPTFKTDVTMAEDVIEEILRIHGLENIPMPAAVRSNLQFRKKDDQEYLQQTIAGLLAGCGFNEMINNSITNSKYAESYFPNSQEEVIRLLSFSNTGLDSLRTSLLFPALEVVRHNHNRKNHDLRLFEFGTVYRKSGNEFLEARQMILVITGNKLPKSWQTDEKPVDLFYLKGITENILRRAGIQEFSFEANPSVIFESGLSYSAGKEKLVSLGLITEKITSGFEVKKEVWAAEFDFDALRKHASRRVQFSELPKFPEVRRDLALVLNNEIQFSQVEALAYGTVKKNLQQVMLFDVFSGEKIGEGKKSYAVSFLFRDDQKTLTDKEVDSAMEQLIRTFEKELGAGIRR
jgi:phenylalanyl-tRNA synthetase beta chain